MVRDGWVVYHRFDKATHQSCLAHLTRRCDELITDLPAGAKHTPRIEALAAWGLDDDEQTAVGRGGTKRVQGLLGATLNSLPTTLAAAAPDVEFGSDRAHRRKVNLALLSGRLDLTATVRAQRRQRYVDLPVGGGDGSHAVAVATMSAAASPSRLLFRVSLENGAA